MGHHHYHSHNQTSNIGLAFFLNLAFTLVEIAGGIFTNSLAILSDALHDLGDSLSLGLSWYFQRLSRKGRDKTFSYGYGRFSLLGAIINSIVLIVGSIIILTEAIPRAFDPEPANAKGMLLFAILGIVVNGIAAFKLRKGTSMNERVVSLHLLEDVLGWAAVLIGSIVMIFFGLPWIDPLLSILITLFILFNVYRNLKESLTIILQGTPSDLDVDRLRNRLKDLKEIVDIHDCHIWSMDGEYYILTVHLVLDADYSLAQLSSIKKRARELLKDQSVDHVTIEFESKDEHCELEDC